jgi:ariadne-1
MSEQDVERIIEMGFKESYARDALKKNQWNADLAIEELLNNPAATADRSIPNKIDTKSFPVAVVETVKTAILAPPGKRINSYGAVVSDDEDDGDGGGISSYGDENCNDEYVEDDNYDYGFDLSPQSGESSPRYQPPDAGKYFHLPGEEIEKQCLLQAIRDTLIPDIDIAEPLLIDGSWNINAVQNAYFEEEKKEAALEMSGLQGYSASTALIQSRLESSAKVNRQIECCICFDKFDESDAFALGCNHWFCKGDYAQYLDTAATSGTSFKTLCPAQHLKCKHRVVSSVFKVFCKPENFDKYRDSILSNFIMCSKDKKYCSGPNCDLICVANSAISICCRGCGTRSCFKCDYIDHAPALCNQVSLWKVKYDEEGQSALWIKQNTQKCPKCRVDIQKNQGCNHMTCRREVGGCGHEFCWICLGNWSGHNACNKYVSKEEDELDSTARLSHFFKRYEENQRSERIAETERKKIMETLNSSEMDNNILLKAHDLVIRCRIALKFSYVYGFFAYREQNVKVSADKSEVISDKPLSQLEIQRLKPGDRLFFQKTSQYKYPLTVRNREPVTFTGSGGYPPVKVRWNDGSSFNVMTEDLRTITPAKVSQTTPNLGGGLRPTAGFGRGFSFAPAPAPAVELGPGSARVGARALNIFGGNNSNNNNNSNPFLSAAPVNAGPPLNLFTSVASAPTIAASVEKNSSSAAGGGSAAASATPLISTPRVLKELFELHQEMLEKNTEILHGYLEKGEVANKILNQTKVTENFLEKIIEQLRE